MSSYTLAQRSASNSSNTSAVSMPLVSIDSHGVLVGQLGQPLEYIRPR